jgi:hypothetical protein
MARASGWKAAVELVRIAAIVASKVFATESWRREK